MIRLHIFNLEKFLCLADQCSGPVNLCIENEKSVDIRNSCSVRRHLYLEYKKSGGRLNLCLNISEVKDYFRLINFSIGDS